MGMAAISVPVMLQLVSADLIAVNNKPVFTFYGIPDFNPRRLLREVVIIDGQRYKVIGVETHALHDVTGHPFGLMVQRHHESV